MKSTSVLALLTALILNLLPPSAGATVSLDSRYDCIVLESTTSRTPVGSRTKKDHSLREIAQHGTIFFQGAERIFIYSSLRPFDAYAPGSGSLVLATSLASPQETHGAVFVTEKPSGSIELAIAVSESTQVFDVSSGEAPFVLRPEIERYRLACDPR